MVRDLELIEKEMGISDQFVFLRGRLPKEVADGWLVSQLGSEYFVFMTPMVVVFALIPWVLLVMFASSFGVGVVGALLAGMISHAYGKIAVSFSRLKRVTVNRSYLSVSRFGKRTQYFVADIERIETKEMRIVTVHFNGGERVYFMGMPGYNIFDDKTSFERILEVYDS